MRGARRLSISILGIALALMATATLTAASLAQDTGFAGKLISAEAMAGAPKGARAYRILYWSMGLDGRPVEVSGDRAPWTAAAGRPACRRLGASDDRRRQPLCAVAGAGVLRLDPRAPRHA
jgi:hypothetical protein